MIFYHWFQGFPRLVTCHTLTKISNWMPHDLRYGLLLTISMAIGVGFACFTFELFKINMLGKKGPS